MMSRVRDAPSDPVALDLILGLYTSVRFGIDPPEIVDFVFGWTTLDITRDDAQKNSRQ